MRVRFLSRMSLAFSFLLGVFLTGDASVVAQEKQPPKVTFDDHVKPIFRDKCSTCHNPDKKQGGLDLTTYTGVMEGGSGGKVLEPGESSKSYIYSLMSHKEEPFMPPNSPKLPDEMLETVRKWIDGGVLENSGSKANLPQGKKFDLTLSTTPMDRPEKPSMPAKLRLEPFLRTSSNSAVTALATSPWAPLVAVAGQKQVLLYHSQTLELLGVLPFPEGDPQVLKFSRNGTLLLVGGGRAGASGKVVLYNVETGKRELEVGDELDTVLAADVSSDHRLVALGGPQRVVRIYTTADGRLIHELRKHTDWIYSIAFSPDGVLLATGDRNGGMYVWEGYTGREYLNLKGHTAGVTAVSWRADSNVLASGSEDGSIKLWEMENGGQIRSWGAHGGGVLDLEFTRDARLVSCGRDKVAKMWDQNGGQQRAFPAFADLAMRVTHCDETNRVIAGDWTGVIKVWNAADGAAVGELSSNPPTLAERIAAAEKRLSDLQAQHKNLLAAQQAAKAEADKAKAGLTMAQAAMTTAQQRIQAATAKANAGKQALAEATAAHESVTKEVKLLQEALPALQEAGAKVQAAAAKLPADKEVVELSTRYQALLKARTDQLAAGQKAMIDKAAAMKVAQQAVEAADRELANANAALAAAKTQVDQLAPTIKPLEEKLAAAQKPLEETAKAVAEAQKQLDRWKNEVASNAAASPGK